MTASVPLCSADGWYLYGQSRSSGSGAQAGSLSVPLKINFSNYSCSSGVVLSIPIFLDIDVVTRSKESDVYLFAVTVSSISANNFNG